MRLTLLAESCARHLVLALSFDLLGMGVSAATATVPEIRQLLQESQKDVFTARLEYTVQRYRKAKPSPELAAYDARIPQIRAINEHTHNRVISVMDLRNRCEKVSVKDLRDIDRLLSDNGMADSQHSQLDRTVEYVSQGSRQLSCRGLDSSFRDPELLLVQAPGKIADKSGLLEIGQVRPEELSDEWNIVLSDSGSSEPPLTTLEIGKETGGVRYQITYECDPALGYRYARKRVTRDGKLRFEVLASDYRDVDGTPFPFQYTLRRFDQEGDLLEQSKYTFTKIQLNLELSAEDFKIQVPPGTWLTDFIFGGKKVRLEVESFLGIEDAIAYRARELAMAEVEDLAGRDLKSESPSWETLIPDTRIARKNESGPMILDLESRMFVRAPAQASLHSREVYMRLSELGKGDIAWNGCLVALRHASIRVREQDKVKISKVRDGAWAASIELQEKCDLPLGLLVVTKEHAHFLVAISAITSEGARVVITQSEGDAVDDYGYALTTGRDD